MSNSPEAAKLSSYVVFLSGTHVTGKETLAVSLSKALRCPWIKAEMVHQSAEFGARSQSKRGYSYGKVFGGIWFNKLRQLGFLSGRTELDGESDYKAPRKVGKECTALLSCYAMRKPARDAIRDVMLVNSIRAIFVIMHITEETLSGRTLGAEEPELAQRIMEEKIADIQEPLEEEKDIMLMDSLKDVDTLFLEIKDGISQLVEDM